MLDRLGEAGKSSPQFEPDADRPIGRCGYSSSTHRFACLPACLLHIPYLESLSHVSLVSYAESLLLVCKRGRIDLINICVEYYLKYTREVMHPHIQYSVLYADAI